MTGHVVWPEGLPGEARRTTSWWKAQAFVAGMQMGRLFPFSSARRIRHARCRDGMPDPHAVEARLEAAGAIMPPGGWPRPVPDADKGRKVGNVHVTTHSVI